MKYDVLKIRKLRVKFEMRNMIFKMKSVINVANDKLVSHIFCYLFDVLTMQSLLEEYLLLCLDLF